MIYAVLSLEEDGKLPDSVKKAATAIFDDYAPRAWFVAFDGTTTELNDLLWPDDEEDSSPVGNGVVLPVIRHAGYASDDLWEWLKVRSK